MKDIVIDYFDNHHSAKELVIEKSKFLFRNLWHDSHHYKWDTTKQQSICWICGDIYSTKNIRMCPGFDGKYSSSVDTSMVNHIVNTLNEEYYLYLNTIERCRNLVIKRYKSISDISGEDVAKLHTTYGCDPETLEIIFDDTISKTVRIEYENCMEQERSLSRSKQKKEIISVAY